MFICLHCGKLSTAMKVSETGQACCPKCSVPSGVAPTGNFFYKQDTSESSSTPKSDSKLVLPPAFGGVVPLKSGSSFGTYCLKYANPLDIPGTSYNFVLPFQDHVSREKVKEKIALMTATVDPLIPRVQVAIIDECGLSEVPVENVGRLVLAEDHHHTFVAALKANVPVWLDLLDETRSYVKKSWTECTYVDHF